MRRFQRIFIVAGGVLVVAIGGVVGILRFASGINEVTADAEETTTRAARLATPSPVPLTVVPAANIAPQPVSPTRPQPAVQDELIRSMVTGLSSHPKLAAWLVTDGITRRFVSAVDAIAGGYSPRDELEFMRPSQPFLVRPDDAGSLVIASGSYRRYDLAVDVVESIDAEGAIRVFRELEPLFDEIHRAGSWTDTPFEVSLRDAVNHLLRTPVPGGQVAVERRTLSYAYADPGLEGLSDAQRQLLRMGPANVRRVQSKLLELSAAFGWSTDGEDGDAAGQPPPAEATLADEPATTGSGDDIDTLMASAEPVETTNTLEPEPSGLSGDAPAPVAAVERRDPE